VWNDLGNLLALHGDLDQAESAYARALELDPARPATRFNLALLDEQRGDVAGATEHYRSLLELDPAHAWAHYQLGAIDERLGRRQQAIEHFAVAFTMDPNLLFAETNPHLIENRLVTEALLHARRGRRAVPATPRAYDEPGRITSLLAPGVAADGAAPREAAPEEEPIDTGPESTVGRSSFAPAPAATQPAADDDHEDAARRATAIDAEPGDRVLDSSDLRGGASNQVRGGGPAEQAAQGRGAAGSSAWRRTLHQAPVPEERGIVRFGQRSTGSLEWRFGPASDEPVPAR
jgi:tetratricopeptide (TPR) repeat protein